MSGKEKKVKCVVAHPKFYMMVDGTLKHIERGTVVLVTEAQFERAGKKLMSQKDAKRLDGGKLTAANVAPAAMPEEVQKALTDSAAKLATAEKALEAEKSKVEKLTEENKKLKEAAAKKAKTGK